MHIGSVFEFLIPFEFWTWVMFFSPGGKEFSRTNKSLRRQSQIIYKHEEARGEVSSYAKDITRSCCESSSWCQVPCQGSNNWQERWGNAHEKASANVKLDEPWEFSKLKANPWTQMGKTVKKQQQSLSWAFSLSHDIEKRHWPQVERNTPRTRSKVYEHNLSMEKGRG